MTRKINLTRLLIVALFCGLVSSQGPERRNIYVDKNMTWYEAQQYCREHYSDLSYINSVAEEQELKKAPRTPSHAWIGLYRDSYSSDWKWSGKGKFFPTKVLSRIAHQYDCVSLYLWGLVLTSCDTKQHFFCYEDEWLVLVQERKTWEEALADCRENYTDLASLPSPARLQSHLPISGAETPQVWTGLHFLAGYWLWVNGDALELQAWSANKLPVCPNPKNHCGMLDRQGSTLKARNCQRTLHFICSVTAKY